jgi:putative transposase
MIRSVAVLGAGTMGAQIAAHFANAGVPALLLDLTAAVAKQGLQRARALKPDPFFTSDTWKLVSTGGFDTDLARIGGSDWIIEAVVERSAYGIRRMTAWLQSRGKEVNHKRVARLLRQMGLETIYPKPRLSQPDAEHKVHPYLLRGVVVKRPNQVWSTDITYIRLREGYVYLVAIMDWFSRYVLSWEISVTLESEFCLSALDWALRKGRPEIFNSDQGSQFTSIDFTGRLKALDIRISMDGRGRALDNVFVERLWRTVKYEDVYLKGYQTIPDAQTGLRDYFDYYNMQRRHSSLEHKTPWMIFSGLETINLQAGLAQS